MSEKSSEYHKKTCIICGCHTNQTINIYEPRSGPNIVRLIQARFKFQPLNEDKYLCFSCNNWLINWHSLQALNSNDADNPSGTSSQTNNLEHDKGSPSEAITMQNYTKPVAQVRPQIKNQFQSNDIPNILPKTTTTSTSQLMNSTKSSEYYYLSKRTFPNCHRIKKLRQGRILHNCCVCGRTVTRRLLTNSSKSKVIGVKCKRCRDTKHRRNMYLKSMLLHKKHKLPKKTKSLVGVVHNHKNLVNSEASMHNTNHTTSQLPYQHRQYQKPLVDGKVVSMLRRLGTTLSRDSTSTTTTTYQPPIMSPAKKKSQKWTRNIDDNEIVINFNTAITEVLPIRHIRRNLTYQISDPIPTLDSIEIDSSDEEEETDFDYTNDVNENENVKDKTTKLNEKTSSCGINLEQVYNLLPKGLTVSLISESESMLVI